MTWSSPYPTEQWLCFHRGEWVEPYGLTWFPGNLLRFWLWDIPSDMDHYVTCIKVWKSGVGDEGGWIRPFKPFLCTIHGSPF